MTLQLKIHINPEYQKLVPEMPAPEFAAFKANIKERGQQYPITVNSQGVILDGHHRYRACQALGIKCEFVEKNFHNELLEKLFVIDANLKRRHLNSFQRAQLALKEKPILEEIARLNSGANLKQNYCYINYYNKAPTVFRGLQTLYESHLPKIDPVLIHDPLVREKEKSETRSQTLSSCIDIFKVPLELGFLGKCALNMPTSVGIAVIIISSITEIKKTKF